MGRTNKLVDGCYSYWQGGLFPLLQSLRLQLPSSAAAGKGDATQAARAPSTGGAAGGRQQQAPLPAQRAAAAAAGPAASQHSTTHRRITVPPLPPLSGRSMLQHAADDVAALQALDVQHRASAAPSADVTEASAALCVVGPAMHLAAECKQIGCKLAGGTELYSSVSDLRCVKLAAVWLCRLVFVRRTLQRQRRAAPQHWLCAGVALHPTGRRLQHQQQQQAACPQHQQTHKLTAATAAVLPVAIQQTKATACPAAPVLLDRLAARRRRCMTWRRCSSGCCSAAKR